MAVTYGIGLHGGSRQWDEVEPTTQRPSPRAFHAGWLLGDFKVQPETLLRRIIRVAVELRVGSCLPNPNLGAASQC